MRNGTPSGGPTAGGTNCLLASAGTVQGFTKKYGHRRTPEGRGAVRAYCERIFRAMHEQERKRIEAMTSSEQLARLRMQWAKEDTESETREEKYLKEAKVTPEGLETFLREIIERP